MIESQTPKEYGSGLQKFPLSGKKDMSMKDFNASQARLEAASEGDLVLRAQAGQEEAFAALFEAHRRRVYSLCLRMTRNTAEAEDLTQEAFLRVFRKISTFRGDSAFSTWLHRLAVNVVLMHLRRKHGQDVSVDEIDTSREEPMKQEQGDDDRELKGCIDRIGLQRAIAKLPPGYRKIFILHDVDGCEHHEIARMLKCSVGNCKSQLHKARLKLRKWLRPQVLDRGYLPG